ncbi:hypothetical protein J7E73_28340 [Paenibacillus albidus]|uniref:hypothetical protein n=1 Tax=Paenibacillus albidus TaxID=2041023 RepID=UPI001BEA740B|nr:hypothetical protein [Paenibacillus albidus]MBT2292955.1 hypothetical protein [Paenibacillus albidus]
MLRERPSGVQANSICCIYNPQVLVFDSLQASMSYELGHLQLVESSLYGENRLLLPTVAGLKWLPEDVPNPFVEE